MKAVLTPARPGKLDLPANISIVVSPPKSPKLNPTESTWQVMGIKKLRALFGSENPRSTSEFDASGGYGHTPSEPASKHVRATREPFVGAEVHDQMTPEIEAQIKKLRQQAGDAWIDYFVLFHGQKASHAELQRAATWRGPR